MIPRTLWVDHLDANARNWPHKIKMRRGLEFPMAIWGQEFFESRFKLLVILVSVTLMLVGGVWYPAGIAGGLLYSLLFMPAVSRWMEIVGHEIEVQSAQIFYGVNEEVYRRNEARALMNYPQFKGRKRQEIEEDMREHSNFSIRFVNHYRKKIEKYGKE